MVLIVQGDEARLRTKKRGSRWFSTPTGNFQGSQSGQFFF